MNTEELKKLRDEMVSEGLAERPKQKPKPRRKRGERPPDAKMPPPFEATEAEEEPAEEPEAEG